MEKFIGVKIIHAKPMSSDEFNLRIESDKLVPDQEGCLVKYSDDYESWSPKGVFDEAYRRIDAMTFGLAIEAMKKGLKVARSGWNGKGMFVYLVHGSTVLAEELRREAQTHVAPIVDDELGRVMICSHIDMKAANGAIVVGWLASQTDMLAEDWQIVE